MTLPLPPLFGRVVRVAPCVFMAWGILWHLLFAGQMSMSYAFYPADLILPPVTGFRTAISMLVLLLAGMITLCYLRKAVRSASRIPDPQSHPIYDVGAPVVVPSFDFAVGIQALEACVVTGRARASRALDSLLVGISDRILPDIANGLSAGTDRRSVLSLA